MSALTDGQPGGTALPASPLVVVCGSRKFSDPLKATAAIVSRVGRLPRSTALVHGDAAGADRLAAAAAKRIGFAIVAFPAHWQVHSDDCRCKGYGWCREAGKRRNLEMLDLKPDLVIAFWNGSSTGTLHTITNARERGLPLEVIRL